MWTRIFDRHTENFYFCLSSLWWRLYFNIITFWWPIQNLMLKLLWFVYVFGMMVKWCPSIFHFTRDVVHFNFFFYKKKKEKKLRAIIGPRYIFIKQKLHGITKNEKKKKIIKNLNCVQLSICGTSEYPIIRGKIKKFGRTARKRSAKIKPISAEVDGNYFLCETVRRIFLYQLK